MEVMSHFVIIHVATLWVETVVLPENRHRDIEMSSDLIARLLGLYWPDSATILVTSTQAIFLHMKQA